MQMGMAITTVDTHTHTTTMLTSEASEHVRALFLVRMWRSLVIVMALVILMDGAIHGLGGQWPPLIFFFENNIII